MCTEGGVTPGVHLGHGVNPLVTLVHVVHHIHPAACGCEYSLKHPSFHIDVIASDQEPVNNNDVYDMVSYNRNIQCAFQMTI